MYQTEQDKQNERLIAQKIRDRFGGDLRESHQYAHYDYIWVRETEKGRDVSFIEIKKRSPVKSDMLDVQLLFDKVFMLSSQRHNSFLFVQWADCLGYIDIRSYYKVDYFKRNLGNRPADIEKLHAFYLTEQFKVVE